MIVYQSILFFSMHYNFSCFTSSIPLYSQFYIHPSMVRIKHRYICIQISSTPPIIISEDSYKNIIYDTLYESFGIQATVHLSYFQIIDVLSVNNMCVFKVKRCIYKKVCVALEGCKRLKKVVVEIKIVSVGSSVKGIRKKTLDYLKNKMA